MHPSRCRPLLKIAFLQVSMNVSACRSSPGCTSITSDPHDETIVVTLNSSNAEEFNGCQAGACMSLCKTILASRSTGGPVVIDRCEIADADASVMDASSVADGGGASSLNLHVVYKTSSFCGV